MKDGEFSASCKGCGCTVSIQFNVTGPRTEDKKDRTGQTAQTGAPEDAPAKETYENEQSCGKKQLNVFGPAALALGALTIIFAFIAGLKALVLGIPAIVVCGLGFLACYLVKNMKKWMPAAGIIMTAAGIIIAAVMREGMVF